MTSPTSAADEIRALRPGPSALIDRLDPLLFTPQDDLGISARERLTLAVYVADLHTSPLAESYAARLLEAGEPAESVATLRLLATRDIAPGPYGVHKGSGALEAESVPGPYLTVDEDLEKTFGARFALALRYTHLLVLHPRDVRPHDLQEMFDAGWNQRQLVALAQLISAITLVTRVQHGAAAIAQWLPQEEAHV